jgi:hypothetical protein
VSSITWALSRLSSIAGAPSSSPTLEDEDAEELVEPEDPELEDKVVSSRRQEGWGEHRQRRCSPNPPKLHHSQAEVTNIHCQRVFNSSFGRRTGWRGRHWRHHKGAGFQGIFGIPLVPERLRYREHSINQPGALRRTTRLCNTFSFLGLRSSSGGATNSTFVVFRRF